MCTVHNGLIKCENSKMFTEILIDKNIITRKELSKNEDKLIMPNPFPENFQTKVSINRETARKLFDIKKYEELMLEVYSFVNGLDGAYRPDDLLNISCYGKGIELIVDSCYTSKKNFYRRKIDNKDTVYFNTESHKFFDENHEELDNLVNFDDFDAISVSYIYF